ncbi:hypothetical protein T265_08969 [Opisthorchis viverrini]|uniref:Uncharacterized protein n=1 Tax=Opisthorchis viverrini TaxID=6198 RepID=A0A074ZIC9_OPIVI|nr:hypothetical protein T265_08969 [Opisthorchis viverrini]KER23070.1 hypothetical protein T265_08969 [Opisthorchis viverrini]
MGKMWLQSLVKQFSFVASALSAVQAARYSSTTEARRKQRIEMKSRLPADMHLPLTDVDQQAVILLILYLISVLLLIGSCILIIAFDKFALRAVRRSICFFCCCLYGFGRLWQKRLDGRLYTTDDEDDSGDELCCFKVTESVRQKSLVTMSTYHKKKRAEHAFSMLSSGTISIADDQSVGSSVQSRLTSGQTLSLPIGKNYRLKDNVVKVRLEFLADLAAYMNARTTAQLTSDMSSTSDTESLASQTSQTTQKMLEEPRRREQSL